MGPSDSSSSDAIQIRDEQTRKSETCFRRHSRAMRNIHDGATCCDVQAGHAGGRIVAQRRTADKARSLSSCPESAHTEQWKRVV